MFRVGYAGTNGADAEFHEVDSPDAALYINNLNRADEPIFPRGTTGDAIVEPSRSSIDLSLVEKAPRSVISNEIKDILNDKSQNLQDLKSIDRIIDMMIDTYCSESALTADNTFLGEVLDNRIVAKAYSIALVRFVEVAAETVQEDMALAGKNADLEIKGYVLGRISGANVLDSTCQGSRIQANVLTLNGKPFYIVDSGNNSELSVVVRKKLYNLGYYNSGGVDRDHMSTIRFGVTNKKCDAFITTKDVLPNNKELNTENGCIFKIKDRNQFLTPLEAQCANSILAQVMESSATDENDMLFELVKSYVNQFRAECNLPEIQLNDTHHLMTMLAAMHKQTTSSVQDVKE